MVVPFKYSSEFSNIIYLCKKEQQELTKEPYYHDRKNSAALDYFKHVEE